MHKPLKPLKSLAGDRYPFLFLCFFIQTFTQSVDRHLYPSLCTTRVASDGVRVTSVVSFVVSFVLLLTWVMRNWGIGVFVDREVDNH